MILGQQGLGDVCKSCSGYYLRIFRVGRQGIVS